MFHGTPWAISIVEGIIFLTLLIGRKKFRIRSKVNSDLTGTE
jgi:hypothetical protein